MLNKTPSKDSNTKLRLTQTKVLLMHLSYRRNLLVTTPKPLKSNILKFTKKLKNFKVSTGQADRLLHKFIETNNFVLANVFNKRYNIFKRLLKTKPEQLKIKNDQPKRVLTSWRKRQLQRKLEYLKRKSARKKRFLKWRAFRLKRRWKRSIARRFAKSYLNVQFNGSSATQTVGHKLTPTYGMINLGVNVQKVALVSKFAPVFHNNALVSSQMLVKTHTLAKQPPILSKVVAGLLMSETLKFNTVASLNTVNKTSKLLYTPTSELKSLKRAAHCINSTSTNPTKHKLYPFKQLKFEKKLVTLLTAPQTHKKAKLWTKQSLLNKHTPAQIFNSAYKKSSYKLFKKFAI